jgi:hypothetical protein
MMRRAPVVSVSLVAIMFQPSTQICLGRQILSTGSGRPKDHDDTTTTQEVNHDEMQNILNSLLLACGPPYPSLPGTLRTYGSILQ